MNIQTNTAYQLTKYELWYLISLTPQTTVIGFRNPTAGMLMEEIFPLIQDASFSLLDRDLIFMDTNNNMRVKEGLDRLIDSLTSALHTILIVFCFANEKKETIRSFNFREGYSTMLEETENGHYQLTELSKEEMFSLFTEPFSDKVFWPPDTDPLYFSQEDISLMQGSESKSPIHDIEESKLNFLETLQNPLLRFSCMIFWERNNFKNNTIDGFSVIAGSRYLWILEVVDDTKKVVCASKNSMKDFNQRIRSLIENSSRG